MYIYVSLCVCVCMCMCMRVCVHVCAYVSVWYDLSMLDFLCYYLTINACDPVHYNGYYEYSDEPYDSSRLRNRQEQFTVGKGDYIVTCTHA